MHGRDSSWEGKKKGSEHQPEYNTMKWGDDETGDQKRMLGFQAAMRTRGDMKEAQGGERTAMTQLRQNTNEWPGGSEKGKGRGVDAR